MRRTPSESEFRSFVADILGIPSETLTLETEYASIPEWDSVMHLRLVLEIEDAYGVEIPIDAVAGIRTLGQFYAQVRGGER